MFVTFLATIITIFTIFNHLHSQASMTMSSILVPYGLLEMILHRNGTTELVKPEPICEDYSDCEDTVDLPPEPETTTIVGSAASKEIFFELNLSFKPPSAPELTSMISTSYGNQPPHKKHYHWETNLEDWNNYWSTQWTNHWRNHWRNHWMHHRDKFNHWERKVESLGDNFNHHWERKFNHWKGVWENPRDQWNTRQVWNTGHPHFQERTSPYY